MESKDEEKAVSTGLSRRLLLGALGVSALGAVAADSLGALGAAPAQAAILWNHPMSPRGSVTKYWASGSHNGIDFARGTNANVYSVAAGQVDLVTSTDPIYGVMVRINHGPNYAGGPDHKTFYGHMQAGSVGVNYGDWVAAATFIGRTGQTGVADGDHLHLGYTVGGVQTDPVAFASYPLPGSPGVPIVLPASSSPGNLTEVRAVAPGSWIPGNLGMLFNPSHLGAALMGAGESSIQLLFAQGGVLYHVFRSATGAWTFGSTGLSVNPTSFSVLNMGNGWPTAMFIENNKLYQALGTPSGWQKLWTGSIFTGQISAVNMGGQWPTVMLVQDGLLWRIYGDTSGWHVESTGIPATGQISAVNMGGAMPQVMMIENSYLHQIWYDSQGWHKASTGQLLIGKISASNMGGQWPTVMLDQGGYLYHVYGDATGWHTDPTYVSTSGGRVTSVAAGGVAPVVYKIG